MTRLSGGEEDCSNRGSERQVQGAGGRATRGALGMTGGRQGETSSAPVCSWEMDSSLPVVSGILPDSNAPARISACGAALLSGKMPDTTGHWESLAPTSVPKLTRADSLRRAHVLHPAIRAESPRSLTWNRSASGPLAAHCSHIQLDPARSNAVSQLRTPLGDNWHRQLTTAGRNMEMRRANPQPAWRRRTGRSAVADASGLSGVSVVAGRWAEVADARGRGPNAVGTGRMDMGCLFVIFAGAFPRFADIILWIAQAESVPRAVRRQLAVAAAGDNVFAVHDAPVRRDVVARDRPAGRRLVLAHAGRDPRHLARRRRCVLQP